MEKTFTYGVIGGGAWGTALASVLARRGDTPQPVTLWAREAETVEAINHHHENRPFLADIRLPETSYRPAI